MSSVFIVGAGGHGREIAKLLEASGQRILGFASDDTPEGIKYPYLGSVDSVIKAVTGASFVVAIGNNNTRRSITDSLAAAGFVAHTTVASDITMHATNQVGDGAQVCAGVTLTCDITIGKGAIVNTGAIISHDCVLGDYSFIGPGVTLSGNVTIGEAAFVGAGATLIPGVSVGAGAVIGAGACVTKDVPANVTAVGVPARVLSAP